MARHASLAPRLYFFAALARPAGLASVLFSRLHSARFAPSPFISCVAGAMEDNSLHANSSSPGSSNSRHGLPGEAPRGNLSFGERSISQDMLLDDLAALEVRRSGRPGASAAPLEGGRGAGVFDLVTRSGRKPVGLLGFGVDEREFSLS